VREAALTQLYSSAIADSLNEISYPALLAGINFSVRSHTRGLSIRVGGYNDKQGLLLEKIAAAMTLDKVISTPSYFGVGRMQARGCRISSYLAA